MKKIFITALLALMAIGANAQKTQTYERQGTTFVAKKSSNASAASPVKTKYTYIDTDGKTYTIYVGKTGACYIIRTSKRTGNEYKKYLGAEISAQICKEMGIDYQPRKK